MPTYTDRLIKILRGKVSEFSDKQKRSICSLVSSCAVNSKDILIPIADNGMRILDSSEIFFVEESKKGKILIHTISEIIEYKNLAFDLLEYLDRINERFHYLHKGLVVNIDKITHYNSYYRKVYLSNKKEVRATGAAITGIVQREIGKEKDESIDVKIGSYEY